MQALRADPEAVYAGAFHLYSRGDTEEAARVFEKLCSEFPKEARFWNGLASSSQESLDYQKALHAWQKSALLDPDNPYLHYHAAECSEALGDREKALSLLAQAKNLVGAEAHPLALSINALYESTGGRYEN